MLDKATLEQLKSLFARLDSTYRFIVEAQDHPAEAELVEMLQDVAATSNRIGIELRSVSDLRFHIEKDGVPIPIEFKGIPGGHEFTTLILAVLNADGKGKLPDPGIQKRIKSLKGPIYLTSYISLSCVNCPDVVQALNRWPSFIPISGMRWLKERISRKRSFPEKSRASPPCLPVNT